MRHTSTGKLSRRLWPQVCLLVFHFCHVFCSVNGMAVGEYLREGRLCRVALELVGAYWLGKDFSAVSREEYEKLVYPGYAEIGTWMYPDAGGELYYFFGPEVKSRDTIPAGMVAIDVPEAEYAVVTVPKAADAKGLRENVKAAWKFIFNDWFDTSAYKFDESKMGFEMYLGEDTFIYVSVLKK